jgi:acetyl/propionyl-CoA carboxylase alpha subunit
MVDTILIANRGEIAARVIRAAHAFGPRAAVAVAPDDWRAAHVALADDAVAVPSYLSIVAIVAGVAGVAGAGEPPLL